MLGSGGVPTNDSRAPNRATNGPVRVTNRNAYELALERLRKSSNRGTVKAVSPCDGL